MFSLATVGQRTSLQSQIDTIEKQFKTTFSYDKTLTEGVNVDSVQFKKLSEAINFLNIHSAFVFEKIDSSNVLVSPVENGKNLLIKGKLKIIDKGPAIGGTVIIENQNSSVAVDIEGNYTIKGVLNDTDSIVFQLIGYDDLKLPISIWNNGSLDTFLLASSVSIDDVIINSYLTNGFQYNHKDQSIDLKVEDLGLLPGETEIDILTSIQALPGINSPTGKSGDLVTRGSDPDKTLISYDNIPIYHKGHYFGTFSPFNTELISDIKIQRNGGQGSNRGGRVGGIIEISTRNKIVDSVSASAGVGTSYYSASANIPIVKKKFSAIVGFRKSYPAAFNSIKIDSLNSFVFQNTKLGAALMGTPVIDLVDYSFNFWDANAKFIYQVNKRHKLELTGISIYNQLIVSLGELNEVSTDTITLSNWGVNLQLKSKWNKSFSSITSLTNSAYLEDIGGNSVVNNAIISTDEFRNGSNDFTFKNLNEFNFKEHQKLSFGFESNYYDVTNEQHAYSIQNGKQESIKSAKAFLHSTFLDFKNYRAFKVFTFSLGGRASYFTGTNHMYFEPRVLANYHLNNHFTFKLNTGKYHQYINHIYGTRINNLQGINTINWQLSNDRDKPVVESTQSGIGFIWDKDDWVVDVEGYAKKTNHISAGNYFTGDSTIRLVHGGYNTIGADFLIKKKFKNLETWLGYSYMNSEAKFGDTEFKYVWNQTHLFNFVLGYSVKNFKISTGWKYVSGFLSDDIRIKFLEGASSFLMRNPTNSTQQETLVDGSVEEYEESFPDNHQMDLSVSYFIKSKNQKWKIIFGGAITNVYDNRIIISQLTHPTPGPPGSVIRINKTGFGRLFNATVKVVWK
tara:strand:- start:4629 stop:7172 length:2544 start_codon:yes stop_codon:yes gene_type:complete